MIESHALISICVNPHADAHAYVACRARTAAETKATISRAGERLAAFVDEYAGKGWLPIILVTDLDGPKGKYTKEVQGIMLKHAEAENMPAVKATLDNFLAKRKDFLFTAWFMESTNEDCKRLIEIH